MREFKRMLFRTENVILRLLLNFDIILSFFVYILLIVYLLHFVSVLFKNMKEQSLCCSSTSWCRTCNASAHILCSNRPNFQPHVTVVVYVNNGMFHNDTRTPPTLAGPMYLHSDNGHYSTYHFMHLWHTARQPAQCRA